MASAGCGVGFPYKGHSHTHTWPGFFYVVQAEPLRSYAPGGHPAITPMVWSVYGDLGVRCSDAVGLSDSIFRRYFSEKTAHFENGHFFDAVQNDRTLSLQAMRKTMLSREDLDGAVLIVAIEGTLDDYQLFTLLHSKNKVVPVLSAGGASRDLAAQLQVPEANFGAVDFSDLFWRALQISLLEQRRIRLTHSVGREGSRKVE